MEFGEWRQEVFIGDGLFEVERSGLRACGELRGAERDVEAEARDRIDSSYAFKEDGQRSDEEKPTGWGIVVGIVLVILAGFYCTSHPAARLMTEMV